MSKRTAYPEPLTASGKIKTYSYLRYSSATQGEEFGGDSVRRQKELIAGFLESHNAEIIQSFEDLGISSFRGKNVKNLKTAAFAQFLERVRKGEIEKGCYLIVEGFDRISRQRGLDTVKIITDLLYAHIRIYTLSDKRLYDINAQNHLEQLLMVTVINERAHDESARKSDRQIAFWIGKRRKIEATKTQRLQSGIYPALSSRSPWWLAVDEDKNYRVVPEHVEEIRELIRLLTFENFGAKRACQYLNSKGSKKVWNVHYVWKILHEEALIGHYLPVETHYSEGTAGVSYKKNGDRLEYVFPAVLTEEELNSVRAALIERKGKRGGKKSFQQQNIFTGLAYCAHCGSTLRQMKLKNRGKEYFYLVCTGSEKRTCVVSTTLTTRYESFLATFLQASNHFNFNNLINTESKHVAKKLKTELSQVEADIVTNKRSYAAAETTFNELIESGVRAPRSLTNKLSGLEEVLERLKSLRNKLAFEVLQEERKELKFMEIPADFANMLSVDIDLRIRANRHLCDHIYAIYFRNKKSYFEESDYFHLIFKNGMVLNFNEHFQRLKAEAPVLDIPINIFEHGYDFDSYVREKVIDLSS